MMENLVIKGIITATSNKQDGEFKQEVPTKTAYLKVDEENSKKLQDFGMTEYSSKEDGEKFFIVGLVRGLMVYKPNGIGVKRSDLSLINGEEGENPNYETSEEIGMNIVKGEYRNNDFFKLQALRVESDDVIVEVKPENPFGDEVAF